MKTIRFSRSTNAGAVAERTGLTLLEIVLALAIFFGGVTALSQLAWSGGRAAVQSHLKTQAAIRCETKLNEILAGAAMMQNQVGVAFPDDPHWTWSEMVNPGGPEGLYQIDVTVSHQGATRLANVSVTFRRWARDPSQFAQAASLLKAEAEQAPK